MSEVNLRERQLSPSQIGCVLNDIALTAKAMQRFAVMLVHADDERDIESLTQGLEKMAERVGLLADWAADTGVGSMGAVFGATVEDWMMPPAFHEQLEQAQSVGGGI